MLSMVTRPRFEIGEVLKLGVGRSFTDKGYMNRAQKRGSLAWFGRRGRLGIMRSGKSMGSTFARIQGATVVAITATIIGAGWLIADGPDETPSVTFYRPLHVPLVNVDVVVGEGDEDQG